MNLLEHYILKVLSEEDCTVEYEKSLGKKAEELQVKVVAIVDCYGQKSKETNYWPKSKWEKIRSVGFYMA